ncbi:ubiquitin carboxyl-hydrolase [Bacteroides ovatus]|uniref:ubiquitin carboxyl-hydrolase n=1 Tax=Bacteroides ovatus TaxID=28116 RepID=UPI001F373024|nr:ubiquitin carboxyl-hydrolase [Bacteroides ovatus]MCE9211779.1 ubiquitin carboxyl-hydrolase [Bacteroides ovatus]
MKQLKFECPECGTEFTLTANQPKAKERIEALKKAGVDVSELLAMQSADGLEFIALKRDGVISILKEDDPIFQAIIIQGTIPNRQLFRRWVMAQMFRIIYISTRTYGAYKPIGVSEVIRSMGYEYQWKMLNNELYAQHKMMQNGDVDNFRDRNRWFNKKVVLDMAKDYIEKLKKRFEELKLRKCKGIPYKRINGQNIFVDDFDKKVIRPLLFAVHKIQHAENTYELWRAVQEFNKRRIKMHWEAPQNAAWLDAYKGSGAFFTMQNMIRFHNCVIIDDNGKTLSKNTSLAFLNKKAKLYENREGWRLIGLLKKMLDDNNIDVAAKISEWRK